MSNAPALTATDWLAPFPPPRSLSLDPEASRIYEQAYYIGLEAEDPVDPAITFTSVALALLEGQDETSKWFAKLAASYGPLKTEIIKDKTRLTLAKVSAAAAMTGPPTTPNLSATDKQLLTSSSREVIVKAENWAQRVGGSEIGVRHLVAAYVLDPPAYHRDQLQRWKVKDADWRAAFFAWVAQKYTWEQWTDASQRAAPAASRVAFEAKEVKGKQLAWQGSADALAVLAEAAKLHRRQPDTWLGFKTVLFALVKSAESSASIKQTVQPIWDAVAKARAPYDQAFAQRFSGQPTGPDFLFEDLDISPRVLNTLETARELAIAARARLEPGADVKATPLHIAGALLSVRVDAADEIAALGLDVQALRKALGDHAAAQGESAAVWREILGQEDRLVIGRPINLNSDEPEAVVRADETWVNDPLAIRTDVEAFGALLASRDLEPPLSIGLFGPWGSGKTTFLRRLMRAVDSHAKEAQDAGKMLSPYVANIVHVEFNAWHYAESALVSSLVDATIRQISAFVQRKPNLGPKGWLDDKLKDLESRRRQVNAASEVQKAAADAVVAAHNTVKCKEKAAGERATSLRAVVGSIWTATLGAIQQNDIVQQSGVLPVIGDGVRDLEDLHQRISRLRARPGRMLDELGWMRSVIFALLILVMPALVAYAVSRVTGSFDFRAMLSSATTILAIVGIWAKAASAAVSKVDQAVATIISEYEQRLSVDPKVVEARTVLKSAETEAATAAAALQAARDDFARAQADVANATLPSQTLQLVSSRIEDRSYAKELTTLSLARADLQNLSDILRDQRIVSDDATNGLRAIDRVVLYIDDLDRCQPNDVVRVLQLVHMLLAFELFVVVVAVDARWIEVALRQTYPWLARDKGSIPLPTAERPNEKMAVETYEYVTPEDYLEKIFQIAFWLEPMTAGRAASYLTTLVRSPASTATPQDRSTPTSVKVDISSIELDYMRALAAYVGTSPRRVKRLVNAYRLIKAKLSDAQLKAFVTDENATGATAQSGPYQIVIGLLVIGTGSQTTSSAILGALGNWDPRGKYEDVVKNFKAKNDAAWTAAAQVIETIARTQNPTDVSELRGWSRQVRRFLLHGPDTGQAPPAA
jgi:KAP-like P-loop domain-containing protein